MSVYSPRPIEKKWQAVWQKVDLYRAVDPGQNGAKKPKFYALVEFPYPSGAGLHVGHVRAWSAMDAYVRKKRMEGKNVLFPIGWDAFGLPAENYALKMGVHPSKTTAENIENFRRQIKALGLSFDWSREVNTTDPNYYKWTQWIFLQLLKRNLAYQEEVPVNWCPFCKSNLADEEVLPDGTHERCGHPTQKRMQKQWLLRITKYADRLIEDLKKVDFPSKVAVQQINWIGRKEGITITYPVEGISEKVPVFTTRPETNFGATFIVLAPEHPLVVKITTPPNQKAVKAYVREALAKTEKQRIEEGRAKTGTFTGRFAINHLTGEKMPIWVSDFVLMSVGTGAVVGVPGHDRRDFEFAKEFGLKVVRVVVGKDTDTSIIDQPEQVQEEEGILVNSSFLNGLNIKQGSTKVIDYLEEKGWGKRTTTYHLHDWIFSRQHYWGEPIPVVYCRNCAQNPPSGVKCQMSNISGVEYAVVPVPEEDLPVELPYVEKYEPSGTGESPLAGIKEWVNVACPICGSSARRETDTMPNWAGSNWYYLAYLFADKLSNPSSKALNSKHEILNKSKIPSSNNSNVSDLGFSASDFKNIFSENKNVLDYWMPVDVYEGGYEHTTLHLLYSRFIYKFLFDIGQVPEAEPYARRRVHGIVLGHDNRKMSKSFGNVVNPDEMVEKFGADALRMYEMFIGPFDDQVVWNANGVAGVYRFLGRVWNLFESLHRQKKKTSSKKSSSLDSGSETQGQKKIEALLGKLCRKITADLENLKFNTSIAALMEFTNEVQSSKFKLESNGWNVFLRILAPFAPHLAEELWQNLQRSNVNGQLSKVSRAGNWSVHQQSWPVIDIRDESAEIEMVVQVNGKLRGVFKVSPGDSRHQANVESLAKSLPKVAPLLEGLAPRVIFVPERLINFVTD